MIPWGVVLLRKCELKSHLLPHDDFMTRQALLRLKPDVHDIIEAFQIINHLFSLHISIISASGPLQTAETVLSYEQPGLSSHHKEGLRVGHTTEHTNDYAQAT